jgi:hypothetical protein
MRTALGLSLLCALHVLPAGAAPFKPYPGAQIDDRTTRLINPRAEESRASRSRTTTIYITTDSYDKVLAFYRRLGREFVLPGGLGRPTGLPEGKKLRQTYIILDAARGLKASKRWVKIQTPYVGPAWKTRLKPGEEPLKEMTAIMYVETKGP